MNEALYTHFSYKVFETLCAFYTSAQLTVDQGSIATIAGGLAEGPFALRKAAMAVDRCSAHCSPATPCPLGERMKLADGYLTDALVL